MLPSIAQKVSENEQQSNSPSKSHTVAINSLANTQKHITNKLQLP
jgi:hypothetical protein